MKTTKPLFGVLSASENNMAAFGFDIHGVLDTYKSLALVCEALIKDGHSVHIMTGARREVALEHLMQAGILTSLHYTHFYSISDDLLQRGIPVEWRADNPKFADKDWDSAKAQYCERYSIIALFDDSPVYGTYMEAQTEFIHIGTRVVRN